MRSTSCQSRGQGRQSTQELRKLNLKDQDNRAPIDRSMCSCSRSSTSIQNRQLDSSRKCFRLNRARPTSAKWSTETDVRELDSTQVAVPLSSMGLPPTESFDASSSWVRTGCRSCIEDSASSVHEGRRLQNKSLEHIQTHWPPTCALTKFLHST